MKKSDLTKTFSGVRNSLPVVAVRSSGLLTANKSSLSATPKLPSANFTYSQKIVGNCSPAQDKYLKRLQTVHYEQIFKKIANSSL